VADKLGLKELAEHVQNFDIKKENPSKAMTDWLKLNVGGSTFLTTRATLTSHPSSSLAAMFAPQSSLLAASMEQGVYNLDACPTAFTVILNWLRYRKLLLGGVTASEVMPVADYFGLPDLNKALAERMKEEEKAGNNLQEVLNTLGERLEECLNSISSEVSCCSEKLEDTKMETAQVAASLEDLWRIKCEISKIGETIR